VQASEPTARKESDAPAPSLSVLDGVALMVGIVIGIGIFKTPSLVAANVASEAGFIGLWLAGGLITLVGALVYAELASAHPSTGGEYHFLSRALGQSTGLMFAWARVSVIQTGAIAAIGFVFGDYAQQLLPLGPYGVAIYAAGAIVVFTGVNLLGTPQTRWTQLLFTALTVGAILLVVVVGLAAGTPSPPRPAGAAAGAGGAAGLALIFILLTYGGWNEAAYLSAEMKDVRRNMVRVLVYGTAVIVLIYGLINLAYLRVIGLEGMRKSEAVAADLMRATLGEAGVVALSLAVCFAALSTLNGTIFTGARVYHALGQDLAKLRRLGVWDPRGHKPANAILLQGAISLALVAFGAVTRDGFQAMVEYTAPVFWFFLLLVGISFFVLRRREPERDRPFRVPLYPLTPILFCLTCAYLLYSSLAYTGLGALIGVAVLAAGTPLLMLLRTEPAFEPGE
jgi:basic amino acid/polyamine antiporter, APA family